MVLGELELFHLVLILSSTVMGAEEEEGFLANLAQSYAHLPCFRFSPLSQKEGGAALASHTSWLERCRQFCQRTL